MRALLVAAATLLSVSAVAADCRFVDLESDMFITFDERRDPVLHLNGNAERYDSSSVGTGMSRRVAYPQDGDDNRALAYEIHEFDGHTFLTWGADLLVERCQ